MDMEDSVEKVQKRHRHVWTREQAYAGVHGDAQSWTRVRASVDEGAGMCGHVWVCAAGD